MRSYGIISPQFWTGRTGREIQAAGADAIIVAVYLMTSPHSHMCGLYYLSKNYIVDDTGRSLAQVTKALQQLASLPSGPFALYDDETNYVWVPEMLHWQVGSVKANDKRRYTIQKWFRDLLPNPFKREFLKRYGGEVGLDIEGHPELENQGKPEEGRVPRVGKPGKAEKGTTRIGTISVPDPVPDPVPVPDPGGGVGEPKLNQLPGSPPDEWTDHNGKVWPVLSREGRIKFRSPGAFALRAFVFQRDGFMCLDCGRQGKRPDGYDGRDAVGTEDGRCLVMDHVVSRRNGGTHHPENLRTLCDACNARKSALIDSKSEPEDVECLGEFGNVELTPREIVKLREKLNSHLQGYIDRLDRYGQTNPAKFRKYKSHYAVILNWFERDASEGKIRARASPGGLFEPDRSAKGGGYESEAERRQRRTDQAADQLYLEVVEKISGRIPGGTDEGNGGGLP